MQEKIRYRDLVLSCNEKVETYRKGLLYTAAPINGGTPNPPGIYDGTAIYRRGCAFGYFSPNEE